MFSHKSPPFGYAKGANRTEVFFMSMIECACCQEPCDSRSMTPCRGCGKPLCPNCARVDHGLCADCFSFEAAEKPTERR